MQLQIIVKKNGPLAQSTDAIYTLMQTLQALNCDALTFGCIASMRFWTDAQWEQFDFDSRYQAAEVAVYEGG